MLVVVGGFGVVLVWGARRGSAGYLAACAAVPGATAALVLGARDALPIWVVWPAAAVGAAAVFSVVLVLRRRD